MVINVGTTPTLLKVANVPVQLFIQNTGGQTVSITPDGSNGGTQIVTLQTLLLIIQNPLIPIVKVYGSVTSGTGSVDIQEWPF